MVKWIVLAIVLVSLLVLALAARPVLARLPQLRRAALGLQQRQGQAEALQGAADELQERVAALQGQAETTQQRLAVIRAKREE